MTETRRTLHPSKDRPDLDEMVKCSIAWFNALSPEQQAEHRRAQRKSWVKGEMLLEHPEMTEAEFEEIWAKVAQ